MSSQEHGHVEEHGGHELHHKAHHDKAHAKDVHIQPQQEEWIPSWVPPPKPEPKWTTVCHEEPEEKCVIVPRQECHVEVQLNVLFEKLNEI